MGEPTPDLSETIEQAFRQSVPTAFAFLSSEFGFTLVPEHPRRFAAKSPNCRVVMDLDHNRFGAWIERLDTRLPAGRPTFTAKAIGVGWIAVCQAYEHDLALRSRSDLAFLHAQINLNASWLRQYCLPLLHRDFSMWADLEKCLEIVVPAWRSK